MIEEINSAQSAPSTEIDEQLERFAAAFSDIRRVMGANFKHAHQHGFSTTQFMLMGHLMEKAESSEPYTISTLAARLGLDPATVVRTVDSLEKRGLVVRRRDLQDRRLVFVEFTEEGRQIRQKIGQHFKEHIGIIFKAMSQEGRIALLAGLEEFVHVGLEIQEAQSCR
jgi:DNA-binding MarR family transcriptional regulator